MIQADWPTCFPDTVLVALSSVDEGTMLDRAVGIHDGSITTNRTAFVSRLGLSYGDVVFQRINYDQHQTYRAVAIVDECDTTTYKSEVAADALITDAAGVGLFLPVADCIPAVIYDPTLKRISLLHLGRHSTVANLMTAVLDDLRTKGSQPDDLIIWFGPSVQKQSYKLEYFRAETDPEWRNFVTKAEDGIYIDMQGYNRAQALVSGVDARNIHSSTVDTATDNNYFSHSNGDTTGRFGVVVMLKD